MVTVKSDKPVQTRNCICTKCGYELEFTGEDIVSITTVDYGGGTDMQHYIICPRSSCKEKNFVSKYASKSYSYSF